MWVRLVGDVFGCRCLLGIVMRQRDRIGGLDAESEVVRDAVGVSLDGLVAGQFDAGGKQAPEPLVDLDSVEVPGVVLQVLICAVILRFAIDQPLPGVVLPGAGPYPESFTPLRDIRRHEHEHSLGIVCIVVLLDDRHTRQGRQGVQGRPGEVPIGPGKGCPPPNHQMSKGWAILWPVGVIRQEIYVFPTMEGTTPIFYSAGSDACPSFILGPALWAAAMGFGK